MPCIRLFLLPVCLCCFSLFAEESIPPALSPSPSPSSSPKTEATLFQDDFEKDLSHWIVEQTPAGTTRQIDGQLDIDDAPGPKDKGGCTVWFKEKISGPVRIEYDATMIQKGGPNDRISDLNCFWMATDPDHPEDFFAKSKERGGSFKKYDSLLTYYVGYGANENATTRFRRYPRPRDDKALQPEYDRDEAKYMNRPNQTRKIQLIADGKKIQFILDGEIIFTFEDPEPYREGYFGFRTTRSHIRFDNFKVTRLDSPEEKTK